MVVKVTMTLEGNFEEVSKIFVGSSVNIHTVQQDQPVSVSKLKEATQVHEEGAPTEEQPIRAEAHPDTFTLEYFEGLQVNDLQNFITDQGGTYKKGSKKPTLVKLAMDLVQKLTESDTGLNREKLDEIGQKYTDSETPIEEKEKEEPKYNADDLIAKLQSAVSIRVQQLQASGMTGDVQELMKTAMEDLRGAFLDGKLHKEITVKDYDTMIPKLEAFIDGKTTIG